MCFCFRESELSVKIKGKYYHPDHTMCHQCKDDLRYVEAVTLVYDDGIVYCNKCLERKRKLQEQKRQKDEHKPLDHSRSILGNCVICQKPVVKGGEVSIHKYSS